MDAASFKVMNVIHVHCFKISFTGSPKCPSFMRYVSIRGSMGKNIIITCLALLLIGSNVWQFYLRVDQGVTMSYMSGELHSYKNARSKMERMLTYHVNGISSEDMLKQLNTLFPEDEPFEKEGYIHSGFTSFKLDATDKYIESVGYK